MTYKIEKKFAGSGVSGGSTFDDDYATEQDALKALAIKAHEEGLQDLDVAIRERQFSVYRGNITYTYKIVRV